MPRELDVPNDSVGRRDVVTLDGSVSERKPYVDDSEPSLEVDYEEDHLGMPTGLAVRDLLTNDMVWYHGLRRG